MKATKRSAPSTDQATSDVQRASHAAVGHMGLSSMCNADGADYLVFGPLSLPNISLNCDDIYLIKKHPTTGPIKEPTLRDIANGVVAVYTKCQCTPTRHLPTLQCDVCLSKNFGRLLQLAKGAFSASGDAYTYEKGLVRVLKEMLLLSGEEADHPVIQYAFSMWRGACRAFDQACDLAEALDAIAREGYKGLARSCSDEVLPIWKYFNWYQYNPDPFSNFMKDFRSRYLGKSDGLPGLTVDLDDRMNMFVELKRLLGEFVPPEMANLRDIYNRLGVKRLPFFFRGFEEAEKAATPSDLLDIKLERLLKKIVESEFVPMPFSTAFE